MENNQATDYEKATMAKYREAQKILIAAEELDCYVTAMLSAIKNDWLLADELAKRAAHKALILLECKETIERVFNDGY